MDELADQVVGNLGLSWPVAERAVGIILDFLATEGPADIVKALLERLPEGGVGGLAPQTAVSWAWAAGWCQSASA